MEGTLRSHLMEARREAVGEVLPVEVRCYIVVLKDVSHETPDVAPCRTSPLQGVSAVISVTVPMPRTVCRATLWNEWAQDEVCGAFSGLGVGMS